jgi:hypothetical protein
MKSIISFREGKNRQVTVVRQIWEFHENNYIVEGGGA